MKKSKRILTVILGCFLLSLLSISYAKFSHARARNMGQTAAEDRVQLSNVMVENIPLIATATGVLTANQQSNISPKIAGYITKVQFNEGQYVKIGTVLIQLDNAEKQQAYLSSQAKAEFAYSTYQRYLKLREQNVTSPQDIDQYLSNYKQALSAAKSDAVALSEMTLRAPISGYLGAKKVNVGDYVAPGQSLVEVTDTDQLKISYSLPSSYSPQLKIGQSVDITADFIPGQKFAARVSYIAPSVDSSTQTIEVHATIPNTAHVLKPGQSVNISQSIGTQTHVMLVPADAVIQNISGSYVYEVLNHKVVQVPVTLGDHYQDKIVIKKGLTQKDRIITKGQFQVKSGSTVQLVS